MLEFLQRCRLDSEKKASQSREEDLQSELKESEAKLKGLVDKTKVTIILFYHYELNTDIPLPLEGASSKVR